ncbi:hypothetical protein [Microcoleus sp. T3_D1]|uniref:hypothetical protein n=1 Tax=Microcoleus sp. T3_D1 TaxID=3055427 RepID=UPI002FCE6FCA
MIPFKVRTLIIVLSGSLKGCSGAIATSYACCQNVLTVGQGLRFRLCGRRAGVSVTLWSLGR